VVSWVVAVVQDAAVNHGSGSGREEVGWNAIAVAMRGGLTSLVMLIAVLALKILVVVDIAADDDDSHGSCMVFLRIEVGDAVARGWIAFSCGLIADRMVVQKKRPRSRSRAWPPCSSFSKTVPSGDSSLSLMSSSFA
jgi:hypothetical protein